ncbi:hypothetical protein ACFL1Z_02860 [Thermodesulfobacteriota bacterium]
MALNKINRFNQNGNSPHALIEYRAGCVPLPLKGEVTYKPTSTGKPPFPSLGGRGLRGGGKETVLLGNVYSL